MSAELEALVARAQNRLAVELHDRARALRRRGALDRARRSSRPRAATVEATRSVDPEPRRRHRPPGRVVPRRRQRPRPARAPPPRTGNRSMTNAASGREADARGICDGRGPAASASAGDERRQREATPRRDHRDPEGPDQASSTSRPTSARSAPSSRSATASPASTASRTASRSSGSSSSTASPGSRSTSRRTTSAPRSSASGSKVKEGEPVRRTGEVMSVPGGRGPARARRRPARATRSTGWAPIEATERRPLEFKAPGVISRQPVKEPLQTGLKAIDSMIPIGRGQRELIIGDRSTGKTAIAIDTILNQRGGDVICVYVAVGQKGSTVAQVVERLRDAGAMEYTIVVSAPAQEAAPIKWMAPFAGCAMGEYFLYDGQARAPHLRRPLEARGRLSAALAPAPAPAGPRGVPGRRLLPPLAAARARVQALRRPRRRLADRAADHRDAGRRHRRLHPDERHLDHRRADLPRVEPLLLGRAAGDQRRHLGLPRGRERPAEGDAPGRRAACASTSRSTASSRRSRSSAPSSTRRRRARSPAASAWSRP